MFQFLKSLFQRRGSTPGAVVLEVAQDDIHFAGRYQVLAHVSAAELLWLRRAGDAERTSQFAITPKRSSDQKHLKISASDFQRVLSAYLRDDGVIVAVQRESVDDLESSSDYRQRDSDFDRSTSTSPSFEGRGGAFGGGGASGSWDATSKTASTVQDAAAVAALTALGVVLAEDAGLGQPAASNSEASSPDASGVLQTSGEDSGDTGSGPDNYS